MKIKIILLIIVLLLSVACQDENQELKFATGSVGGMYYPMGSAISEVLSDHVDSVNINSYMGNASVANSKLIAEDTIDMALVQGNVAFWASNGLGMFEGESTDKVKGIASLYSEAIHIIVSEASGFENLEDLKGKRLNIGPEGSGHYFDAKTIIEAHGMTLDDFIIYNYSFNEAVDGFINGELDAAFITTGVPATSVLLLDNEIPINLLSLSPEIVGRLLGGASYYTMETIDSNDYASLKGEVKTVATKALWVCSSELSEELVYEMTKSFWDHSHEFDNIRMGIDISIDKALLGMSVELHPGAEKYYKELSKNND